MGSESVSQSSIVVDSGQTNRSKTARRNKSSDYETDMAVISLLCSRSEYHSAWKFGSGITNITMRTTLQRCLAFMQAIRLHKLKHLKPVSFTIMSTNHQASVAMFCWEGKA